MGFDWNCYEFVTHLNDRVMCDGVADKTSLRSRAFRSFLSHYDRQDMCEEDKLNHDSDAIKKMIHKYLMVNEELLPQSILHDPELIKNADAKTTNLFFQMMLMVDYEANIHRIASRFSEHNPKLYKYVFEAVEEFYVDVSCSQFEFASCYDPSPPTACCDEPESRPHVTLNQPSKKRKPLLTNTIPEPLKEKLPFQARSSMKIVSEHFSNDSHSSSESTINNFSGNESPSPSIDSPAEVVKRQTPRRRCAPKKNVSVKQTSTGGDHRSESSSSDEEAAIPSGYVKKELLASVTKNSRGSRWGPPKARRVKCTFEGCSKTITNKPYVIREHMKTHTKEKPFKCEECGKELGSKQSLINHGLHHRGLQKVQKRVPCTFQGCAKMLDDNRKLIEIHMRTHTGEKPFQCDECGKTFSSERQLKRHMPNHTGERFTCVTCGKGFITSNGLKLHSYSHTGGSHYPRVKCTFEGCSTMINDLPSAIRSHMRGHTGEKPYECKECGSCFAYTGSLANHKRIAHGGGGKLNKVKL